MHYKVDYNAVRFTLFSGMDGNLWSIQIACGTSCSEGFVPLQMHIFPIPIVMQEIKKHRSIQMYTL